MAERELHRAAGAAAEAEAQCSAAAAALDQARFTLRAQKARPPPAAPASPVPIPKRRPPFPSALVSSKTTFRSLLLCHSRRSLSCSFRSNQLPQKLQGPAWDVLHVHVACEAAEASRGH